MKIKILLPVLADASISGEQRKLCIYFPNASLPNHKFHPFCVIASHLGDNSLNAYNSGIVSTSRELGPGLFKWHKKSEKRLRRKKFKNKLRVTDASTLVRMGLIEAEPVEILVNVALKTRGLQALAALTGALLVTNTLL